MSSLWCLIEFIDWRYSQSCWYFRQRLSNLLTDSSTLHTPLPCVNKYRGTCIHTVCNRGRGSGIGGLRQINTSRQVPEKSTFRAWCLYRYLVHGQKAVYLCAAPGLHASPSAAGSAAGCPPSPTSPLCRPQRPPSAAPAPAICPLCGWPKLPLCWARHARQVSPYKK